MTSLNSYNASSWLVKTYFVFLKMELQLKILVSSSPTEAVLFSEHIPCLPKITPAATLRNIHIWLTIEWGKCEFGTQDIGSDCGPVGVRFSQHLMSRLPDGVQNVVNRNCIPLMSSDSLNCLFHYLLSSHSYGGPALVIWVLQKRNKLL